MEEGLLVRERKKLEVRVDEPVEEKPKHVPHTVYVEGNERVIYTPQGNRIVIGSSDEIHIMREFGYVAAFPDEATRIFGLDEEKRLEKSVGRKRKVWKKVLGSVEQMK